MAQFFKATRKKAETKPQKLVINVDVMDHHGNGICLQHKPIVVVAGGFTGERYEVLVTSQNTKVWHAKILKVLNANTEARTTPFCPYVNDCGGCSHQDFKAEALLSAKQERLTTYVDKNLSQFGSQTAQWEPAIRSDITSTSNAYRRRARLAIDARNPKSIKIGFRQNQSNNVVDIPQCLVLSKGLQAFYPALVSCLKGLDSIAAVGHITLTEGADERQVCLHLTKNLSQASLTSLIAFAEAQKVSVLTLDKVRGLSCLYPHESEQVSISIRDDERAVLQVKPNDFVQVNGAVNSQMLQKARQWLSLNKNETLVDLFSGTGNFSLALAPECKRVLGFEGLPALVQQARNNAQLNHIDNCEFEVADLSEDDAIKRLTLPKNAVFIIDPSRDGAHTVMQNIAKLAPTKIVYVSCNPTSFVRDLQALPKGYMISKMCALDMFPFTKHIEMMAMIEHVGT
ncbi:23S rRNA (uracil(1939)-C(5))-methyltransferase RlmD [Brumicola blandensis]|uniref:23S rRNA (Uracil(1939)-C(5))-methyltransferase RlmD n=1 Tax=Brumicola blandensis TaxID=3075611 RepID=A0AAW8R757_9ALTE|nr:23S rRNA (uracil(1939)-C(5))-methyltransferase RlmD [Alteromonas sp. W409]MDT0584309.1 23S rRNA (uracil(1939)-C(5))-methyltransferase RlmD [Alteromonas sp. W409]